MSTNYPTDHDPNYPTTHSGTQIKNKKPSVAGLVLGVITAVLTIAAVMYLASYTFFGFIPPNLKGEMWAGLSIAVQSFFGFIVASIIGIIGLIVSIVKRKRMDKKVFIVGISLCLLPAVVFIMFIVLEEIRLA